MPVHEIVRKENNMDFLSKLLKADKKDLEKAAKGLLNNIMGGSAAANPANPAPAPAAVPQNSPTPDASPKSGFSWGEEMPDEENQFNYDGTFMEYFESIFRAELASYATERTIPEDSKRVVYTFFSGSDAALVIQLMSEGCSSQKTRNTCKRDHIPYLRFYYDHKGWWNTRAYVEKRIRDALR